MPNRLLARLGAIPIMAMVAWMAAAIGEARAQTGDFKGFRDPPGMKRFAGSRIDGQLTFNFTEYDLVIGKADWTKPGASPPVQHLEGRHIRTLYLAPTGATPLEVSRNYEDDLKAAGAEILFRCRNLQNNPNAECGVAPIREKLYPTSTRIKNQGLSAEWAAAGAQNVYYFAAKIERPEGDHYIALATWEAAHAQLNKPYLGRTIALLDTIQVKGMDRQMAFVDARAMQATIERIGRISLYGILFDTDSATIKPESDKTLAEIGQLLNRNPTWKLQVVGHTDNVGGADYNRLLSQRRAQSVVEALTQKYGVAPDRLTPDGRGLTQPIASNDNESGRARNRRVELIK